VIKHINNTAGTEHAYRVNAAHQNSKTEKSVQNNDSNAGEAVTVKISQNIAYPPINPAYVQKALEETEKQSQAFVEMLRKLFLSQGKHASAEALKLLKGGLPDKNLAEFISGLKPDQETIDKAKEAISEDGYYGVKKTSERILNFAKAIAGNDPEKLEQMREAAEKGFAAAKEAWGKELPDICKQTYDAVMKGFDEWKASLNQETTAA